VLGEELTLHRGLALIHARGNEGEKVNGGWTHHALSLPIPLPFAPGKDIHDSRAAGAKSERGGGRFFLEKKEGVEKRRRQRSSAEFAISGLPPARLKFRRGKGGCVRPLKEESARPLRNYLSQKKGGSGKWGSEVKKFREDQHCAFGPSSWAGGREKTKESLTGEIHTPSNIPRKKKR